MSYTRKFGASGRNRTNDTRIFSPLLYLLSYRGMLSKINLLKTRRCVFNLATSNGLEPSTSSVTGWRANRLHHWAKFSGGNIRARTCDLLLVRQMLSQLSYAPVFALLCAAHLSDVVYYTQETPFCQAVFPIFFKKLLLGFIQLFPTKNTIFLNYSPPVSEYLPE